MPRPINIIYLHSHDTGRYIQPYGYAIPTPNLQRFAEQGVLFRQAFCAAPTCSPSRASLLTGTWAHVNGMLGLAHRGPCRLKDYSWHLSRYLRDRGYATALAGVQHETQNVRDDLGYDVNLNDQARPAEAGGDWQQAIAHQAARWITQPHDRPFFLSCGFFLTHRTGKGVQWHNDDASPLGDPRYVRPPAPLPDTPTVRQDMADYMVAAGRLDACAGVVLDALARSGQADRTLVVITTDHGIAFPFMKCNLTDHGLGVMLMMRGPDGLAGGKVIDGMVSQIDVFPTLCEAAGLDVPAWVAGTALQPLIHGQADSLHDEVFAEVNWHASVEPMRCVRTTRWKYIRRYDGARGPVRPNCDDSVTKNQMLEAGWAKREPAAESLYDLAFDPHEAANLAGDPAHADALKEMRGRLDRWMRQTQDPLCDGALEPWPGMLVNPVDGDSPQDPVEPATRFLVPPGRPWSA